VTFEHACRAQLQYIDEAGSPWSDQGCSQAPRFPTARPADQGVAPWLGLRRLGSRHRLTSVNQASAPAACTRSACPTDPSNASAARGRKLPTAWREPPERLRPHRSFVPWPEPACSSCPPGSCAWQAQRRLPRPPSPGPYIPRFAGWPRPCNTPCACRLRGAVRR